VIKRLLLVGWSLVLLTAAACGGNAAPPTPTPPPQATVAVDANDNINIPYLPSGQGVPGTLEGDVSAQLYAFNATAGNVVDVSVVQTQSSPLDPFMVVLNNSGGIIAVDDNSGEVPNSAYAQVTIPADGTYFVIAASPATIDGIVAETLPTANPYVVTATGHTPPANQGQRILYYRTELTPGVQPERRGYSSPEETVYYYAFNGTAGQTITATMQTGELDSMLALFAPNGNRIAVNDDARTTDVRNTRDAALEGITLPVDGTYLLMATDVGFYQVDLETYPGGFFDIMLNSP